MGLQRGQKGIIRFTSETPMQEEESHGAENTGGKMGAANPLFAETRRGKLVLSA